jgi:hypothetical protein
MDIWQERGLAIAESNTVKKNRLGWQVPSQSGNGTYPEGTINCKVDKQLKEMAVKLRQFYGPAEEKKEGRT